MAVQKLKLTDHVNIHSSLWINALLMPSRTICRKVCDFGKGDKFKLWSYIIEVIFLVLGTG